MRYSQNMLQPHNKELSMSWYVFWGWSSKIQLQPSGWGFLTVAQTAHWTGLDCELEMTAYTLCSSAMPKDFAPSLQAIVQILLTKMKASGTCDASELFQRASWNFTQLAKTSTKTPFLFLSPLHSPRPKTIMTQLAAGQLSHCSVMSENEIDLKILPQPRLEQKGLLCWLY